MLRVQITRIDAPWPDEQPTYRLCEDSGAVCDCWLPGLENPEGPLDCGGFDRRDDAQAFKLGIDRERALFGLIPESVEAIDRERAQLDRNIRAVGRPPADFGVDATADHAKPEQLEIESANVSRVYQPPVVEYQRRVA